MKTHGQGAPRKSYRCSLSVVNGNSSWHPGIDAVAMQISGD